MIVIAATVHKFHASLPEVDALEMSASLLQDSEALCLDRVNRPADLSSNLGPLF